MEITTIHLDMVQSVALAIVSYYIGMWIKNHSAALQRFSIPAPVIGGLLLVGFWFTSTILGILQNAIGMGVCSLMGIDKFYGILAGAVALMGGLGTSAAFGPFF